MKGTVNLKKTAAWRTSPHTRKEMENKNKAKMQMATNGYMFLSLKCILAFERKNNQRILSTFLFSKANLRNIKVCTNLFKSLMGCSFVIITGKNLFP